MTLRICVNSVILWELSGIPPHNQPYIIAVAMFASGIYSVVCS